MTSTLLEKCRKDFHSALLNGNLIIDSKGVPSIADKSNNTSKAIARGIVDRLGAEMGGERAAGQVAGNDFEDFVRKYLECSFGKLGHLRCGTFKVEKIGGRSDLALAEYAQYAHLRVIDEAIEAYPELKGAVGVDYTVAPDVVISRMPEEDDFINQPELIVNDEYGCASIIRRKVNELPILHASVSCKWTMRSDRAQNARSEALNLIRNRKGPVPHITVVTAEPMPSRIASLASGTGDIDCVYHFALNELIESIEEIENKKARNNQKAILQIMTQKKRLKDISDLPLDLAL